MNYHFIYLHFLAAVGSHDFAHPLNLGSEFLQKISREGLYYSLLIFQHPTAVNYFKAGNAWKLKGRMRKGGQKFRTKKEEWEETMMGTQAEADKGTVGGVHGKVSGYEEV